MKDLASDLEFTDLKLIAISQIVLPIMLEWF